MAVVGRPPEPVDREEEVGRIVGAMTDSRSNVNYALVGHRKMGKSTILGRVRNVLAGDGRVIVGHVDLGARRHPPARLAEALTESLTESYLGTLPKASGAARSAASALSEMGKIKGLRGRFTVSIGPSGGLGVEIDQHAGDGDPEKALLDAFEYANKLSAVSKKRVLIMIDEFQHIADYGRIRGLEEILDIFKTIIEGRTDVSFVVSGSGVHHMRGILGGGQSALFGDFVMIDIGPLEKKYAVELFIRSASQQVKNKIAEAAFEEVGGHPYYLVMLAEGIRRGESVRDAYVRLLTSPSGSLYLYANYIMTEDLGSNYMGTNYPEILVSLAGGPKSISELSRDSGVAITSLPKALKTLVERDIIAKSGKEYSIRDGVVRDFFRWTGTR